MMTKTGKPAWRTIRPVLLGVVAALLVGTGISVWLFGAPGAAQQAAAIGGPFTLENGDGTAVTQAAFRGKVMLVYFGYTFCPDVCPTTLNDVAQALDKLGTRADQVAPLFITVDPARDTPTVMSHYVAAFSPRLIGLTGTPDEIATAAREYRVYYAKHKIGPGPEDYTMDHSSVIYVMDRAGRFAGVLRANEGPDALASDLGKYLS